MIQVIHHLPPTTAAFFITSPSCTSTITCCHQSTIALHCYHLCSPHLQTGRLSKWLVTGQNQSETAQLGNSIELAEHCLPHFYRCHSGGCDPVCQLGITMGWWNLCGSQVWVSQVWVRVGIWSPMTNPYLWCGCSRFASTSESAQHPQSSPLVFFFSR